MSKPSTSSTPVDISVVRALVASRRYRESLPLLDEHLAGEHSAIALLLTAKCLRELDEREDALQAYRACIFLGHEQYDSLINIADILREEDELEDAFEAANAAVNTDSERCEAYASRSLILSHMGALKEALADADLSIRLRPDYPYSWYAKATALIYGNKPKEAIFCYDKLISLHPDFAKGRMERGMAHFMLGDYEKGFTDYESRWDVPSGPARRHESSIEWNGAAQDANLILWGEQGLGDEIFFCGLATHLPQFHSRIVIEVDDRLEALFTRSFPNAFVTGRTSDRYRSRPGDTTLPMGSILARIGTTPAHRLRIPPFLKATALDISPHHNTDHETRQVGICWHSSRTLLGRSKSISLQELAPLARYSQVQLLSLQHNYRDAQQDIKSFEASTHSTIHISHIDIYNDIDQLASLIKTCTAVITIPGVVAHLAAALGVKTYVISVSPRGRIWYWHNMNKDQMWYTSARVFAAESASESANTIQAALGAFLNDFPELATEVH